MQVYHGFGNTSRTRGIKPECRIVSGGLSSFKRRRCCRHQLRQIAGAGLAGTCRQQPAGKVLVNDRALKVHLPLQIRYHYSRSAITEQTVVIVLS